MADGAGMHDEDRIHPSKLVIEACRSNNPDLLADVINDCSDAEAAARLLNESKTAMGNYAYHEAALRGNWEIIDMLLDQEGFECDPRTDREQDTPLHSVVRYINEQPKTQWEPLNGLVEMMLEAGNDPRCKNKANLKAQDLVDPTNKPLRKILEDTEYNNAFGADLIDQAPIATEDEDPTGSNSDSDFDIEKKPHDR